MEAITNISGNAGTVYRDLGHNFAQGGDAPAIARSGARNINSFRNRICLSATPRKLAV